MTGEKDLKNVQKAMFEIRTALLNNENVRKLLFHDSADALNLNAPTVEEVKNYVTFFPITQVGIQHFDKNTFMSITCPSIDTDMTAEDKSIYIGYFITLISTKQLWELENNKIRLIELISEIIKTIDNQKFCLPSTLQVLNAVDLVLDETRCGYIVKIMASDLQKDFEF